MTLDDAAAALDVTEEHLKDLIRDGKVRAKVSGPRHRRRYEVNGSDVRKRRHRFTRRGKGRSR
jgi:hypothetical protein